MKPPQEASIRTCYRIWALVVWILERSKETGVCSKLGTVRK